MCLYKDKNLKLNNNIEYLLSILNRLCKLFPDTNIYKYINQIITCVNMTIEEKEKINEYLLTELEMCENYMKDILKDNELKFLKRLNKYQDVNKNKLIENTNFILNNSNRNNNYIENNRKSNPYIPTNYISSLKY